MDNRASIQRIQNEQFSILFEKLTVNIVHKYRIAAGFVGPPGKNIFRTQLFQTGWRQAEAIQFAQTFYFRRALFAGHAAVDLQIETVQNVQRSGFVRLSAAEKYKASSKNDAFVPVPENPNELFRIQRLFTPCNNILPGSGTSGSCKPCSTFTNRNRFVFKLKQYNLLLFRWPNGQKCKNFYHQNPEKVGEKFR
uniref:Uncharacterized protein n=1 Tax=Romanomermis culicivorax TaxID=13658 RepID=A0A915HK70_ROMCU